MASITKEFTVAVRPEVIWDALKDFGNIHTRLFPGILTDAKLESDDTRVVTFSSGKTIRERIVDIDDAALRFVYTASGGVTSHHNASVQLFADGDGTRLVWISDFLPHDVEPQIQQLVDTGAEVMTRTLEAQ